MKQIRIILALVLIGIGLAVVPSVEAATVYSIALTHVVDSQSAYNTPCDDDTCDEDQVLYYADFDVTDRVDPVTVDLYIYAGDQIIFTTATMTATGTFYTSSYVGPTGWACSQLNGHNMFCKARIDQNTNARITIRGRENAPSECTSLAHTTPAGAYRAQEGEIWKHSDPAKSGSDTDSYFVSCLDGNTTITTSYQLYYNNVTTYKPTGTAYRFADLIIVPSSPAVPGPITYNYAADLPAWMTVTGCTITNGGTWYSPYNPPTCTIIPGGKAVSTTVKFGSNVNARVQLTGTIGSIPECPSTNTFTKNVLSDTLFSRNLDGAWNGWGAVTAPFKCQ